VNRVSLPYSRRGRSLKKAVQAALCFIAIGVFASACAETESSDFRLTYCDVDDTKESSMLVFRSQSDEARTIIFMDGYREFALRWSTGKFIMSWEYVLAVQIKPVQPGSDARLLAVRYKYRNNPERVFEGGVIDRACLAALRARYGAHLKFEDI
jgi:hypothetical protein